MKASWICAAIFALIAPTAFARPFVFKTDSLAFPNETVFRHSDAPIPLIGRDSGGNVWSRRCFVVCRSVEQFRRFARFDPKGTPPGDAELKRLVRRIARRPVWMPELPADRRIVIPGYPDLRTLSAKRTLILQQNLGLGWPAYVRPGNFCLPFPASPAKEKELAAWIDADLARGRPTIVWLTEWPQLMVVNHVVLVFARKDAGAYWAYDPNYADQPRPLTYEPAKRAFSYGKSFYFAGGFVRARRIFRGPVN